MSKYYKLIDELKQLQQEGYVAIKDNDIVTILKDEEIVRDRILRTGPWGGILLLQGSIPYE